MVAICLFTALFHTADAFGVRQPTRLVSLQSKTSLLQTKHGSHVRVEPAFFEESDVTANEDETADAVAPTPHPTLVAALQQVAAHKVTGDAISLSGRAPQILGQKPQQHVAATTEEQGPQLLAASSEETSAALPIKSAIATAKQLFALVSTGAHAAAQNVKPAWWDKVTKPVAEAPHEAKVQSEVDQMQLGAMSFFHNARMDKDGATKNLVKMPKTPPAMIAVSTAAAKTATPPRAWASEEEQRRQDAQWQEVRRGRAEEEREAKERERQRLLEEKMDRLRSGGFD